MYSGIPSDNFIKMARMISVNAIELRSYLAIAIGIYRWLGLYVNTLLRIDSSALKLTAFSPDLRQLAALMAGIPLDCAVVIKSCIMTARCTHGWNTARLRCSDHVIYYDGPLHPWLEYR